jgi:hypothetical protein
VELDEQLLDDPLEALARVAHPAPLVAVVDDVALLLEDEHVVAVLDDVGDPRLDERAELLAGRRARVEDLLRAGQQRVHELVADRDQQLLLAAEVVVEAAGADPQLLGELGHRGLVVAALGEHARGAEDDLGLAAVVALLERRASGPGRHRP